jgi:outer membrane biosynthesis protein TonB
MKAWLENLVGPDYATALLWTIVALIVLLVLLVAIRVVRAVSVGTFVSGGRQRKTRLAVMDATAIDSHRRLVLVRRDDVEHLILIGGPTDVVVEQAIRMAAPARRPAVEDSLAHEPPPPVPPEPAREQQPRPVAAPVRPAPSPIPPTPIPSAPIPPAAPAPAPAIQTREPVLPEPPLARPVQPAPPPPAAAPAVQPMRPVVTPPAVVAPPASVEAPARADLDDALLRELEVSLDREAPAPAGESIDEEMSKLLRDLAGNRQ